MVKRRFSDSIVGNSAFIKKGWKNCSVTVGAKVVAVSSAIGQYLHEYVDVYECEGVFALVNNPTGEYHALPFSSVSGRKLLNSRPLVRFLKEKYGCDSSLRLHAWLDGDVVLFCKGSAGKNVHFNDGFSRLDDVLRLRYDNSVKIQGHRIILSASLSEGLGERMSVYRYGKMYAFFNDENGILHATYKNKFGTKLIRSKALACQIEKTMGKGPWYGVAVSNGIVFSGDINIERKPIPIKRFKKIDFADLADSPAG
jgi:hypothetical protein